MTRALLEWETIDSEQIDDIMAGGNRVRPSRCPPRLQQRQQSAAQRAGADRDTGGRGLSFGPCQS
jgi:hypothetical protein